ncbi:alpha/beta hydrolase [Actinosynnema sp. NPDC059335]|uniref:alpha/beta hydrolase n=1 Tax=Actinosynnema sp. NPDC059335 TaxID=3346804 RepID=UPI00366AF273
MCALPRPPLDPELAAGLALIPDQVTPRTLETLPAVRQAVTPLEAVVGDRPIEVTEHTVTSYDGAEIIVTVFRREGHSDAAVPGVYHIHGGGMITGNRFRGAQWFVPWIEEFDVVAATVEYRLAPENPDPTPVEDCYAGLEWFTRNAAEFGFDPDRVLVMGGSAGGGLAAGVTLLARDRGGPGIAWQFLSCPMLDDRDQTVSTRQIVDGVPWARDSNRFGWQSLLGERYGTDDVSVYAAPARATDLSGLPPTYLDVGDAEVFRDEVVAFASKLWEAGINCELHVWAGGFHGFGMIYSAQVSVQAAQAGNDWISRQFSRLPRRPGDVA